MKIRFMTAVSLLAGVAFTAAADVSWTNCASAFYKDFPLFSTYAKESEPLQSIDRFGPVGIGIELLQPAFQMRVKNVEAGSPAAATGKLKAGQLIESINGQTLKDIDPRLQLGALLARAEATDGLVKIMVKDQSRVPAVEVVVQIPVLGSYSRTWPVNCSKSDAIVRNLADFVATNGPGDMGWGTLFLLSTGEGKDLAVVRGWMQKMAAENQAKTELDSTVWHTGYIGLGLCEYYLRTGDEAILHTIELSVEYLRRLQYNDAWGHWGVSDFKYMDGGHMNAAGVHATSFLLLARECGVAVDERMLTRALQHFFRFAGHGNLAYGDHLPEEGFVDNGKTGGLAFEMQAAVSLTPDGEASVYARARDISASKSFYSQSWMLHGHTGGGIGEVWRGAAMGLVRAKKPRQYREFMDNRAWFYDLSRRFDGSFGILGGGRYDDPPNWGAGMGLVYTIPRQTLRLTGAPATRFCRSYPLPDRPWGNAADEAFYALVPASDGTGKVLAVENETLVSDAAWPVLRKLNAGDVSDELLLQYARHPEFGIRGMAADVIRKKGRNDLAIRLLKATDSRVRAAGIAAIGEVNEEITRVLLAMVENPQESWWVTRCALEKLDGPALIAPHVDRLVYWLHHDDWWLSSSAMSALAKLATDRRYCQRILPMIGQMITTNTRVRLLAPVSVIAANVAKADPDVRLLGLDMLKQAYANFPREIRSAGGLKMDSAEQFLVDSLAGNIARMPGGFDELYGLAKKRYPSQSLPHRQLFLTADASRVSGELQKEIQTTIEENLIPELIGAADARASNRKLLRAEAASEPFKSNYTYGRPRMEELVELYNRMGVHDYDWHDFGPVWNQMPWDYYSFDPPEEVIWTKAATRYRDVTVPAGMENWYAKNFDARQAGWQHGLQPFGQEDGKLRTVPKPCSDHELRRPPERRAGPCKLIFCRCCEPLKTLWDKEVLLMRGSFKFPEFKEGCRYRLVVGGQSEIGNGDGYRVYVNGKLMLERTKGVGNYEGGQVHGCGLDRSWWPAFREGEATIAVTSFLKLHAESNVKRGFLAVWLQEMKVPPIGETEIRKSMAAVPLLSAEWQALQDPNHPVLDPEQGKFRWDGKFMPNPKVIGTWTQLGEVATIETFTPQVDLRRNTLLPARLTFAENGRTDDPLLYYTGDKLLHLNTNQALWMRARSIGGADYLFVEAGGFDAQKGQHWQSPLLVMKREVGVAR